MSDGLEWATFLMKKKRKTNKFLMSNCMSDMDSYKYRLETIPNQPVKFSCWWSGYGIFRAILELMLFASHLIYSKR